MAERRIVLKGDPLQKEGQANATITPGMLIETMSTGKLRAHANAGQTAAAMFAIENSLQGEEIGDNYAANDMVQYVHASPGDEILALLKNGENAAVNSFLESDGAGSLKVHAAPDFSSQESMTIYGRRIVAKADEALNLTTSALGDVTAERRIRVTVI